MKCPVARLSSLQQNRILSVPEVAAVCIFGRQSGSRSGCRAGLTLLAGGDLDPVFLSGDFHMAPFLRVFLD